jgi:phage baseplate assembly protein W
LENELIGKGLYFPLRPGSDGKLSFLGGAEKIRQSILLILSTAPGERVMLPEYGCGIHELLFEANTAALRASVQSQVQEALTRWEPRIDVLNVRVEPGGEFANQLLIRIDYRVRANNSIFNLVYPFFINEGAR